MLGFDITRHALDAQAAVRRQKALFRPRRNRLFSVLR